MNLEKQLEIRKSRLAKARSKVRRTILTYFIEGLKEKEGLENSVVTPPYNEKIVKFIEKYG